MNKPALVIPYFGEWPNWFEYYLFSLEKNPKLTVYFFSDISIENIYIPQNAKFIFIPFKDYCQEVSKKLNIKFNPLNPYKLCDLKPFYPFIHRDILKSHDYVGWGDIDLIYGDLDIIFSQKKMLQYDIISLYSSIISGPFTLIKNDPEIYINFFNIPNWGNLLESPRIELFDEIKLSIHLTPELNLLRAFYDRLGGLMGNQISWMDSLIRFYSHIIYPKYHFRQMGISPKINDSEFIKYIDGRVYNHHNKELPLIHFFYLKKSKSAWGILNKSKHILQKRNSKLILKINNEGIYNNYNESIK